jgi:hypothetical protein
VLEWKVGYYPVLVTSQDKLTRDHPSTAPPTTADSPPVYGTLPHGFIFVFA